MAVTSLKGHQFSYSRGKQSLELFQIAYKECWLEWQKKQKKKTYIYKQFLRFKHGDWSIVSFWTYYIKMTCWLTLQQLLTKNGMSLVVHSPYSLHLALHDLVLLISLKRDKKEKHLSQWRRQNKNAGEETQKRENWIEQIDKKKDVLDNAYWLMEINLKVIKIWCKNKNNSCYFGSIPFIQRNFIWAYFFCWQF